jgi:hypothetical protein
MHLRACRSKTQSAASCATIHDVDVDHRAAALTKRATAIGIRLALLAFFAAIASGASSSATAADVQRNRTADNDFSGPPAPIVDAVGTILGAVAGVIATRDACVGAAPDEAAEAERGYRVWWGRNSRDAILAKQRLEDWANSQWERTKASRFLARVDEMIKRQEMDQAFDKMSLSDLAVTCADYFAHEIPAGKYDLRKMYPKDFVVIDADN